MATVSHPNTSRSQRSPWPLRELGRPTRRAGARALRIVAVAAPLFAGCASFTPLPSPPDWRGPAMPPEVRFAGSQQHLLELAGVWEPHPFHDTLLLDRATAAIWQSGWVVQSRRRSDESEPPTLTLRVVDAQGSGPAVLSIVTAFLVPGVVDHRLDVEVDLTTAGGQRTCQRTVETRTWYQPLFVFAYPFRSPAHVRVQAVEAMTLGCLAEVLQAPP